MRYGPRELNIICYNWSIYAIVLYIALKDKFIDSTNLSIALKCYSINSMNLSFGTKEKFIDFKNSKS